MKTSLRIILCGLLFSGPLWVGAQQNLKGDPAYLRIDEVLDMQQAKPEVNVNLPQFLLKNALSEFNNGPDDPFAAAGINLADLLKDIKLIRVLIIEATSENRSHVDSAVAALREDLASKWTSIVNIPDENIGVYALSDEGGQKMAGLAMLMADDGDVIIGNVVGELPLGKLLKIAAQMKGPNGDLIKRALSQFAGVSQEESSAPAKSAKAAE
jgi:hypothetical protein